MERECQSEGHFSPNSMDSWTTSCGGTLCRIFEVQAEPRDARQKQMACISFVPGELVGQTNEGGGNNVLCVNYWLCNTSARLQYSTHCDVLILILEKLHDDVTYCDIVYTGLAGFTDSIHDRTGPDHNTTLVSHTVTSSTLVTRPLLTFSGLPMLIWSISHPCQCFQYPLVFLFFAATRPQVVSTQIINYRQLPGISVSFNLGLYYFISLWIWFHYLFHYLIFISL